MNKLELVSRGDQKMQKIKYVFIFCFSYFCFLIASLSLIGWKKFLSQWFWQFSARSYSACKKCTIKAHQSAICQNFVSWQNLVPILYDVIEFNFQVKSKCEGAVEPGGSRGHCAFNPSLNRTNLNPEFKPISAGPLMCQNSNKPSKPWAELGGHSKNEVFPKNIV